MTKSELRRRVSARKNELDSQSAKLNKLREGLIKFIDEIKGRSAIYNLLKNLPLWKKLTELIQDE